MGFNIINKYKIPLHTDTLLPSPNPTYNVILRKNKTQIKGARPTGHIG